MKIDKNIPMPQERRKYPCEKMEVGDSFFIKGKTTNQVSASIQYYQKGGKKFTTRAIDDGIRVWRTK